ncbi:hypothetical protein M427DRAFT_146745 [Gonapodya prolifera JEL478]|uniref:Mitochondrial potassium channel ATP-binding subunit n=1 Tax=Gonapodya prolifera (strain JEL478) TaxID=1344416 RepID=A0A139A941_GONPJ|nr:hypothetical protein M427DRAFT_146745 [Gonapodya prolifera JEL478]|eukprot:KXS13178.1 hypothetical protein M427DRAFT_146745 [Gonapodya prolifera JEL478]
MYRSLSGIAAARATISSYGSGNHRLLQTGLTAVVSFNIPPPTSLSQLKNAFATKPEESRDSSRQRRWYHERRLSPVSLLTLDHCSPTNFQRIAGPSGPRFSTHILGQASRLQVCRFSSGYGRIPPPPTSGSTVLLGLFLVVPSAIIIAIKIQEILDDSFSIRSLFFREAHAEASHGAENRTRVALPASQSKEGTSGGPTLLSQDSLKPGDSEVTDGNQQKGSQDAEPNVEGWVLAQRVWEVVSPDWVLLVAVLSVTLALSFVSSATPAATGALVTAVQNSLSSTPTPTTIAPDSPIDRAVRILARRTSDAFLPLMAEKPAEVIKTAFSEGGVVTAEIARAAGRLAALFLAQGVLTFLDISLVSRLGERVAARMRNKLYGSILRHDMAFFDARMGGEVVGRLTDDVGEFKLSSQAKEQESDVSGVSGEVIGNIRTVRAFGSEGREESRFEEKTRKASEANERLGFHIGIFQGLTNATLGGLVLSILYWGGQMVAAGDMSGGDLMQFLLATQTAQRSLSTTGVLFSQSLRAVSAAQRVFSYVELQPSIPTEGGERIADVDFMGKLEFCGVSFTYPTRPKHKVLHAMNLTIPNGKVTALCGQSGSGKSTVAQLCERFYEPQTGSILVDGRPLNSLDPTWLRTQIGYIDQNPVLFATSIFENIRYGKPDATLEEVRRAAKQANADEFISSWPDGYNTKVGEKGVTVSGGQKQRIAIARALLKNPKILILDEATSALDAHSEKLVQEALETLMQGRTVLIVAHRLSTIEGADQIVVMSSAGKEARLNGNVVEVGSHARLMQQHGAYFELYNRLYNIEEEEARSRAEQ